MVVGRVRLSMSGTSLGMSGVSLSISGMRLSASGMRFSVSGVGMGGRRRSVCGVRTGDYRVMSSRSDGGIFWSVRIGSSGSGGGCGCGRGGR